MKLRLRSDVPLGAFLSGGYDSSTVVALMAEQAVTDVKTFSIGFPVKEYDESEHARKMAEYLDTDHHALEVTPDAIQVLPELAWHYDEPFADSSAIPTWYLSEMTRREVTVALSGDGGDELFLGYPRYRAVALSARLERIPLMRHALSSQLWTRLPSSGRQKSNWRRWQRFCQAFQQAPDRRYLDWISIFRESQRATLYREDFLEKLDDGDPADFVLRAWKRVARRSPVTTAALTDLVTYLPCDLMTKVDVASMAHSLECRQPFLDYRLVELAASLPASYHFNRGGKRLLQSTFSEWLPEWVWKRPKMGFAVPLDHWFRDELRELTHDTLLSESAHINNYFRRETIEQLVSQHESKQFDHAYRLWALLVLELWSSEWMR